MAGRVDRNLSFPGCSVEKKMIFFLWISAILLLYGHLAMAAVSSDEMPSVASYEVDRIRLEGADWGYPTPYAHYPRGPGGFKMCLIFDSLLERGEKGVIPWLAMDYQVEEGGKSYVFTLRKGVTWHDGHPFTPDDVIFSLTYASRHAMTWSYIFNAIESVERVQSNEEDTSWRVRVTVRQPAATMLYNIGRTRIIPKHIWEGVENPKQFTEKAAVIGTGPYCLDQYSKAHGTYRFTAYKNFWGPRQRVGVVEYVPVSQPILAFDRGEIDLTAVPPDLLKRYQKDPSCQVIQNPAFWGYRLLFNMADNEMAHDGAAENRKDTSSAHSSQPHQSDLHLSDQQIKKRVFAQKAFRQGIRYALNLNDLVQKIARGGAVPGNAGILPPDHVMVNPHVKSYHQNGEKAAACFAKCQGLKSSMRFELLCSSREVRMAELIREFLDRVGVTVQIRSVDSKTRDARVRNQEFEMAIIGHGGWGGDADYLRGRFLSSTASMTASSSPSLSSVSGYGNGHLDALLEAQYLTFDPKKREALIHEVQSILAEDLPEIPLYYTAGYVVFRPKKYDGWQYMFDHHSVEHSKLSWLERN